MSGRWRQLLEQYGRMVLIGAVGGVVTVAGIAMLVLPGPGIAVTLLGLAILATEFSWARRAQRWARSTFRQTVARAKRARAERARRRAGRVDRPVPARTRGPRVMATPPAPPAPPLPTVATTAAAETEIDLTEDRSSV